MRFAHWLTALALVVLASGGAVLFAQEPLPQISPDDSQVIQAAASTLPKPLGCGCKLGNKSAGDCGCNSGCQSPGAYSSDDDYWSSVRGGQYGASGQSSGSTGTSSGAGSSGAGSSGAGSSGQANSLASNFGASSAPASVGTNMLGDFLAGGGFGSSNIVLADGTRYGAGSQTATPFSSHTFKMADTESAWPRNRIFYNANYFNNVGDKTGISRQLIGAERTLFGGVASVGLRAPLYTVNPGSQTDSFTGQTFGTYGGQTGSQTSVGDLTIFLKTALHLDEYNGNAISAGAAIVTPTGPTNIGGITPLYTVNGVTHSGSIQPYLAFYKTLGDSFGEGLFAQGFISADVPFSAGDSTYLFTDFGLGYIMRTGYAYGLTALIPTIEGHVNTPLNNVTHGITATPALLTYTGNAGFQGTPTVTYTNQTNITTGVTAVWNSRTTLAFAAALPISDPHPYNYELQIVVNRYFGSGSPAVPNMFR